jgi:cysteine desulfurase family protein (TIGR01976 family)
MHAARAAVAALLGAADARCISFGQNMTTLNFSLSAALGRALSPGDEIVITELDHEANRGPWLRLRDSGIVVHEVRLLASGLLDHADLREKITPRTRVLAIGLASNALGTVNDVALARRLTRPVGALLVVDAVHYAPHFPLDVQALDVDFLLCSAYKFYGPHVGILYSAPGALDRLATDRLSTQDPAAPFRIETGTLNHAAIWGVHAALEYLAGFGSGASLRARLVAAMTDISAYEHRLARYYHDAVRELPGVRVFGPDFGTRARAPTVSITVERHTASQAAAALAAQNLCVWDGSFYAARAVEVLGASGRGGLLRTGVSLYTTEDELNRLLAAVAAM